MLEKLFSDIPNPYGLTYEEYMDQIARKFYQIQTQIN